MRLLVVEDDPNEGKKLTTYLAKNGYEVEHAISGDEALAAILGNEPFHLVILDVMLPRKSGFDVLKEARQAGSDVPIIILSAHNTEKDKLRGFNLGADDYVTKPFSEKELEARIRVILKRIHQNTHQVLDEYAFADMVINFSSHSAEKDGQKLQFTALEFSILHYFVQHRGRTVSRKQLLSDVWGIKGDITTRTIDRHVASLRKKIEGNPAEPKYIQTVYGIGYKFTG